MKKILITLLLCLLAIPAFAGELIFAWDVPEDTVEFYTLYQVDPNGATTIVADGVVGYTTTLFYDTERGDYYYYLTANALGEESEPSNVVGVHLGKPNPPKNLNATKKKK